MPVMNMKTCRDCKETKPLDDFYRAAECKQGRQPRCKVCQKAYIKTLNYASWTERKRRARAKNPTKAETRRITDTAIATGKLIPAKFCSECGSQNHIHGHHDDYLEPLMIRWLCRDCHVDWHRKNGWSIPINN